MLHKNFQAFKTMKEEEKEGHLKAGGTDLDLEAMMTDDNKVEIVVDDKEEEKMEDWEDQEGEDSQDPFHSLKAFKILVVTTLEKNEMD